MKLVPGTLIVPSNAIFTLDPAFTEPIFVPSVLGGTARNVPEVEIVFPVAGAPRPSPAVTAVTVPLLLVDSTPEELTLRPGPTEITPRELTVAFGSATPGKVCPAANVMIPAITPPDFGSAAFAVACAAVPARNAVLAAVCVAAFVLSGEARESDS
jgi:hypothetical protein